MPATPCHRTAARGKQQVRLLARIDGRRVHAEVVAKAEAASGQHHASFVS